MSDFWVVCFDVRDQRRLQKIARELENFGVRVQKSIFECHLGNRDFTKLQKRLLGLMNREEDHLRCYRLCPRDARAVEVDGTGKKSLDHDYFIG
ncbi:CRISPR-associated endonuclease Cas2 [Desulfosarcina sp. OttesenSCG-928-A07]|nr:CRISPR-associated endonuclease Cas2 [Desulfosarcina sp. OttesenSCG-928-G17]MDL2330014.1 CRISPR-associated endonuclease Cas2 [Desulfosarcina sp. OttesenSCG-928-A07]